jgi:hypothetical protein
MERFWQERLSTLTVMVAPAGIVTSSVADGITPPTHDRGSFQLPPVGVAFIGIGAEFQENALKKLDFLRVEKP